jgi:hypothetical protein
MKTSLKQSAGFTHEFTGEQEASCHPIATGLFLCVGELDEGFGCRMFHQEFGDNLCTIVGDGRFPVGFVEHLVKTLRSKGTLH